MIFFFLSRSLSGCQALLSLAFPFTRTPVHTFIRTHLRSRTMSLMLRPALTRSALRRATTAAPTGLCCRNFTSSTWLLSPQPSLKLHEELQRSFEPHGRGASRLRGSLFFRNGNPRVKLLTHRQHRRRPPRCFFPDSACYYQCEPVRRGSERRHDGLAPLPPARRLGSRAPRLHPRRTRRDPDCRAAAGEHDGQVGQVDGQGRAGWVRFGHGLQGTPSLPDSHASERAC